jgi:hypothetical protein
MKYLCLVYGEESALRECSDRDCLAFDPGRARERPLRRLGGLESVAAATTVRVRNGKVSVTDGPFAETKEQLAGFYLIDARDLNEAISLAAKIPPAQAGQHRGPPHSTDPREPAQLGDRTCNSIPTCISTGSAARPSRPMRACSAARSSFS